MCDFHSVLGVALGEDLSIYHDPSNDHSNMRGRVGETATNAPMARKAITFEAEWDGEGDLPSDAKLIRNIGECPERLVKKLRDHYIKLQAALTTGKFLEEGGYFGDTAKWCDVWNAALAKGAPVKLPAVFRGNLKVYGSAKLDALTQVGGDLDVSGSAKLDAPALTEVGGHLVVSGSAKLDALTQVGGNLDVYGSAKLDAPALTEVGGNLDVSGSAKLDAPKLNRKW
jgi:hypothetical protein